MNKNSKWHKVLLLLTFLFSIISCSNDSKSENNAEVDIPEVYECSVVEYKALHKLLFNKNENKTYTIRITDKNPSELFSIYTGDVLNIILDLSNCTELEEFSNFPSERNIKKIILPNSIKKIHDGVLNDYNAQWLEAVEINNGYYKSHDGIVFTADKKTLIAYPPSRYATSYEIPITVERILTKAFYYTNLVTIKFTKAILIEKNTFNGDYLKYGIFNGTVDECQAFLDQIEDNKIKLLDYTLSDGSSYKFSGNLKVDVQISINILLNSIVDSLCLYYYDSELNKNILISEFTIAEFLDSSKPLLVSTQLFTGSYKFIITTKTDNEENQIYQTQLEVTASTRNIVLQNHSER